MKKVLIISFLIFTMLSSYLNICYAETTPTITKENADYYIELQVGRTHEFTGGNYFFVYILENKDYIKIENNENKYTVTGLKIGTVRGYLYETDNNNDIIEKTFYISVTEKKPNEVIIIPPTKTIYEVGEKLDLEGLVVTAIYDNNEIKSITKGYTVKGYNANKQGKQTVTISYKGFSKSFDVQVGKTTYPNADDNNMIYVTETETKTENKTDIEKLPQTGYFSYIKVTLYFISGLLSIALIYLVYKSFKHSKK